MSTLTLDEAIRMFSKQVLESGIPLSDENRRKLMDFTETYTRASVSGSFYFQVKSSFSVECTLNVDFQRDWDSSRKDTNNDHINIRVQLNWCSTYRSVSNAQASIALYQQMTNLGATLDAMFEDVDILLPKTICG